MGLILPSRYWSRFRNSVVNSPTVHTSSVVTGSGSSTSGVTVTLPDDIAPGNLLVVALNSSANLTTTPPSGWNVGRTQPQDQQFFWKIATGFEGATAAFSWSSSSVNYTYAAFRVSGTHASESPSISSAGGSALNATTADWPAITASWGSANNIFVIFTMGPTAQTVSGWPSGYTEVANLSANSVLVGVAYRLLEASSDDPASCTYTAAIGSGVQTTQFGIAVRPYF